MPKGYSESLNLRKTANTMAKRKRTKQRSTKHTRIPLKVGVYSGAPEG